MNVSDIARLGSVGVGHEEQFDYDGNGNVLYIGVAQLGSSTAAAVWYIQKFTYDVSNRVTRIQCSKTNAVWDNRATTFP